jgi:hypothetical protein
MLELLTNTLTFPGAVVHEWSHAAVARSRGLRVREVVLFRPFANPAGYVRHSSARRAGDALAIALAPFLTNTVLAAVLALLFAPALGMGWAPAALTLWLSWSLALHAPPSFDDMADVDRLARSSAGRVALSVLLAPLRLLKALEPLGSGYVFATAVVFAGALVSIAWTHDVGAALAVVEWFVDTTSAIADALLGKEAAGA